MQTSSLNGRSILSPELCAVNSRMGNRPTRKRRRAAPGEGGGPAGRRCPVGCWRGAAGSRFVLGPVRAAIRGGPGLLLRKGEAEWWREGTFDGIRQGNRCARRGPAEPVHTTEAAPWICVSSSVCRGRNAWVTRVPIVRCAPHRCAPTTPPRLHAPPGPRRRLVHRRWGRTRGELRRVVIAEEIDFTVVPGQAPELFQTVPSRLVVGCCLRGEL